MPALVLDPEKSLVRIHTFAEGLFSRLAHDLELVCGGLEGTATRDGDAATAVVVAPLGSMSVAGVLKGSAVDAGVLSDGDKRDILDKMRRDVFHADGAGAVKVEVTLQSSAARVRVTPPKRGAVEVVLAPQLEETSDGGVRVRAAFEMSLASVGSDVVKGPMGAFRVKDRVKIAADLTFLAK